jgi:hypothetical protein
LRLNPTLDKNPENFRAFQQPQSLALTKTAGDNQGESEQEDCLCDS